MCVYSLHIIVSKYAYKSEFALVGNITNIIATVGILSYWGS